MLTRRQYEAFARYYLDGIFSDEYVAEMLGVKRPAAQKLRTRAVERIREELEEMELSGLNETKGVCKESTERANDE